FSSASVYLRHSATPEPCSLSLHDALPIWMTWSQGPQSDRIMGAYPARPAAARILSRVSVRQPSGASTRNSSRSRANVASISSTRSEEHTPELQSQSNIVCRLLLDIKKRDR